MKLIFTYSFFWLILFCACQKTSVYFQDNSISSDPNITFWNNYAVSLSTYKLDTFATSGDSIWLLGSHPDPEFGRISASGFAEIQRPETYPFKDANIIFDSAAIVLIPNGSYYGDTTQPFRLTAYTLSENLGTDTASSKTYYNTSSTLRNSTPIASINTLIKPLRKDSLFMRLTESFSADLYQQMKNSTSAMNNQAGFRSYLKGICIEPDTINNKAFYQFTAPGGAGIIRMYYTVKGLYNESKYFDIQYIPFKQYNRILFNYNASAFSAFSPSKSQLIKSTELNNKAFLNNYIPSLIKLEFPDILDVKQTYPYVKVMRAELEIRVNQQLNTYPYTLPGSLIVYISNQNNDLSSILLSSATSSPQTGNLSINDLVANGTKYSYDITDYINTVISEGRFSTKSLFLSPYISSYYSSTSRLVVNNQTTDPDIRLKLYVLGL
jgi:hypothetical protein